MPRRVCGCRLHSAAMRARGKNTAMSIYDQDLDKNPANYVALSPVSFVERSAEVFGDLPAVIHGRRCYTWRDTRERAARLAAALPAPRVARGTPGTPTLPHTPPTSRAPRHLAWTYTPCHTGNPKGVVTHHRGAYLNAVCNAATWSMPHFPTYLWTLPMFHCNGWCFPWTVAMLAGTHVCLRKVETRAILEAM